MKENIQIRNLAALRAIKEATLAVMDPEKSGSPRVVVGLATCGIAAGAQDVYDAVSYTHLKLATQCPEPPNEEFHYPIV